jgi:hypothetical protein
MHREPYTHHKFRMLKFINGTVSSTDSEKNTNCDSRLLSRIQSTSERHLIPNPARNACMNAGRHEHGDAGRGRRPHASAT